MGGSGSKYAKIFVAPFLDGPVMLHIKKYRLINKISHFIQLISVIYQINVFSSAM